MPHRVVATAKGHIRHCNELGIRSVACWWIVNGCWVGLTTSMPTAATSWEHGCWTLQGLVLRIRLTDLFLENGRAVCQGWKQRLAGRAGVDMVAPQGSSIYGRRPLQYCTGHKFDTGHLSGQSAVLRSSVDDWLEAMLATINLLEDAGFSTESADAEDLNKRAPSTKEQIPHSPSYGL